MIEPNDTSKLKIVPGEDRVTLMTCAPYGVNTHRLLVSAVRSCRIPGRGSRRSMNAAKDARTIATAAVGWSRLLLGAAAGLAARAAVAYSRRHAAWWPMWLLLRWRAEATSVRLRTCGERLPVGRRALAEFRVAPIAEKRLPSQRLTMAISYPRLSRA